MKKVAIILSLFVSVSAQSLNFEGIADMNHERYGAGYTTDGEFVYAISGSDRQFH